MNSIVAGFVNGFRSTFDPEYVQFRKDIKMFSEKVSLVGLAALVAGIALFILNIAFVAAAAVPAGIICLALTLPCVYVSYNSRKLSDNLRNISKNPQKYINNFSSKPRIQTEDLKQSSWKRYIWSPVAD